MLWRSWEGGNEGRVYKTDLTGGQASPAQGTDAPSHSFLTGTYESATILLEGNSLKKTSNLFKVLHISGGEVKIQNQVSVILKPLFFTGTL